MRRSGARIHHTTGKARYIFAVGVFLSVLLYYWPASTVAYFSHSFREYVSYRSISGSIWRGTVTGLTINGIHAGNVKFNINPLSLLRGEIGGSLRGTDGDIVGQTKFSLGFGNRVKLSRAKASIRLDAFQSQYILGVPLSGNGNVSIDHLHISKKGCHAGEGSLSTNILDNALARYGQPSLELSGPLSCENLSFVTALAGQNEEGLMDISLRVQPDLQYEITVGIEADDRNLSLALVAFGFEDAGSKYTYNSVGVIRGVRS